jgi:Leucine-rich repeat (LRR) protein
MNYYYLQLTNLPLQIIGSKNLEFLHINNNRINFLSKEFGTLPLIKLELSHNYLGTSDQSTWTWLKQTHIRNNLLYLDISHNCVSIVHLLIYIN